MINALANLIIYKVKLNYYNNFYDDFTKIISDYRDEIIITITRYKLTRDFILLRDFIFISKRDIIAKGFCEGFYNYVFINGSINKDLNKKDLSEDLSKKASY